MSTDKLPTASSPDSRTVNNLANLSSEQRLEIQETLRTMEARDWINRYKRKIKAVGKREAYVWWLKTIDDIVKKRRGKAEADDLRRRMNEGGKN
jgi:gamma-glutamyl:cysteine ligase YbdK (ATP-grasp superfamily)